jgi:hypothetical protein
VGTWNKEGGTRTAALGFVVSCSLFLSPLLQCGSLDVPMPERTLSIEKRGFIAGLTLRWSETQSTVDSALLTKLADACEAIEVDDEVRVVLLTAEGDDFCRGWDAALLEGEHTPAGDVFGCLAELPRPVVCAIQGDALSAGLELALACDVRVAADDASLGLPETKFGRMPMGGGTQRLARLVGKGKALEMILTGESVDAQEDDAGAGPPLRDGPDDHPSDHGGQGGGRPRLPREARAGVQGPIARREVSSECR